MGPAKECWTKPCSSSIILGGRFNAGLVLRGSLSKVCLRVIHERYGARLGLGLYLEVPRSLERRGGDMTGLGLEGARDTSTEQQSQTVELCSHACSTHSSKC